MVEQLFENWGNDSIFKIRKWENEILNVQILLIFIVSIKPDAKKQIKDSNQEWAIK